VILCLSFLTCLAGGLAPAAAARTDVDLIIEGDYLVTMDPALPVLADGALAVADGVIVDRGPRAAIHRDYRGRDIVTGTGRIVMPGLVNGHTHAAMTLMRGIADDLELMEWLTGYIFPMENRFVDRDYVRVGTELACWEMIKGGTTAFADMYFFPEVISNVVVDCGLRAIVGAAIIEQESPYSKNWRESLGGATRYVRLWRHRDSRVTPAYAPHAPYTVSPPNLREVRARANELNAPILIHISETQAEVDDISTRYGATPVHHLDALQFFSGRTVGAHLVWATASELPVLASHGVGAVHNPTSNLKLASGFAPVPAMLEAGVNVGLGTDGAASNNDLDMWEEIRLAALIHKAATGDPRTLPAATVLRMATLGGAEALGLADTTGALTVGRRADVIQVELNAPHLIPVYDVISHLVYVADAQDVVTTVVDGRVLMRDRRVLTLDTQRVTREAASYAARIKAALAAER
ncbi:MAG: amidohydrolase family protein, partial [Gammaproteobacteria bacterium]|nr:amidohydrolase family protein [Gammaproteobacteria bacterium]